MMVNPRVSMDEKFEQLDSWKKAKELCLLCYRLTTQFPRDERFAMIDQIKRASVSVPSNIAEGYSRQTGKDKNHFMDIAIGSVYELLSIFSIALDLGYVTKSDYYELKDTAKQALRLINGFKRYVYGAK